MFSAPIPDDDDGRLATLQSYAILDTPPEQGFEDVTALATFICSTPFATITFVDKDRQWFKSEAGFGSNETNRSNSFCACAIMGTETLIVEDTLHDPRFAENPFVLGGPRIRFYAGAPLVAPNGHVLGTVCVFDNKPRTLSPDQLAALEALARQVMSLLEARVKFIDQEKAYEALIQTEKLAALGRFASSMSHEINNPLEAVTNLIFLARQRAVDTEQVSWLEQADRELKRVSNITSQTLRFHKQSSSPQAITCLELIAVTLSLYEARLQNAGVTVEKRKLANQPVICFEGDIRQVLSNLVSNAIDAMPVGGRLIVRSREAIHWPSKRKGLVLTVADTGTGMDPVTLRRSSDAFFSTKGFGGLGLGLWISKEILDRHEGSLRIRSKPNCGTVVTLFLPFTESLGPKVAG